MSMELMEFLTELNPALKEKFDKVTTAIQDRRSFYEKNTDAANKQNTANSRCTTDGDTTNMASFQALYDLKYGQDEKSKAVVTAMDEAMNEALPMLKALFGEDAVKITEPEAGDGWHNDYNKYKAAGQISINGSTYDFFNNTTGDLQCSTSPDLDEIAIVRVQFDNEGDGQWYPNDGLLLYDEPGYSERQGYDGDDG